ncbi:ABC transporter permease [Marispirochaeta aestuarii]|uniref:ABC transporter permease n=1 Tax=Marispirochaeta aestuarii TaxID=1963862 RepID=A0A1Y1RUI5_9SPIO|nr:TRAP transporter large permease [Marispirochaeta aestuarii]ORC30707.1 ABC transporter permease [Marispirochaeta aestuarii]
MSIILIFTGLLLSFLILGVPVAFSIAATSIVSLIIKLGLPNLSFGMIAQMLIYGINNFPLLAVPLFLLAGTIMNSGGISRRIFDFAQRIVGSSRGGLAHVNIIASLIFSGMSGAAAADVAGLGPIELKAMKDAGYDDDFSCAVTGASSTIGPIIPPSVPMVLYGVLASVSVSKLFIGGIIPGLLLAVTLMVLSAVISAIKGYPRGEAWNAMKILSSLKGAFFALLTPLIIIGGIWTGVFTPTEAAAVTVVYSVLLGLFYQESSWQELFENLKHAAVTASAIMFILAAATIYNAALARTQMPEMVIRAVSAVSENPFVVLIILQFVLFIAGCFMSTAETITLFTPLFIPMLEQFGIDPLHFGVVMVLNLMLGQLTPPFGIVLFVLSRVGNLDMARLVKACLPFYIPILVVLIALILFPPLVTYLPNLVFGNW